MKALLNKQFWAKSLMVLGVLFYSNVAFANLQICFTKQVSDSGEDGSWFDADTQNDAVEITG